jgi:hypothetical protein
MPCGVGCGLLGGGQQLKQLQLENDRLLAEYRAQRDRLTKLQETNADLEARVGEAEKLLAQSGIGLPSSRISQAPPRAASPSTSSRSAASASTSGAAAPPYVPPSVPSLPGDGQSAGAGSGEAAVKWRPLRRQ